MRILIYTDNHYCQNSSIVRGRGSKYSDRLENQISTLNFVEKLADQHGCELIINGGDFFNSPDLNSEELSALKEIRWSDRAWHIFLVGNHDASNQSLQYSATNLFSLCPRMDVISKVTAMEIDARNALLLIPYLNQSDLSEDLELGSYTGGMDFLKSRKVLAVSHNDLKGVQFGGFISKTGLSVEDIETHCDLCFNGHMHNHSRVSSKIWNLGNITGQNFSEDAFLYNHVCVVVNTEDFSYTFIENPYAYNFYNIDLTGNSVVNLPQLRDNAVVSVRCDTRSVAKVKELVNSDSRIKYARVSVIRGAEVAVDTVELPSINYRERFRSFILEHIGSDDITQDEVQRICAG